MPKGLAPSVSPRRAFRRPSPTEGVIDLSQQSLRIARVVEYDRSQKASCVAASQTACGLGILAILGALSNLASAMSLPISLRLMSSLQKSILLSACQQLSA